MMAIKSWVVAIFLVNFLTGCAGTYLTDGIGEAIERNSTHDMCLSLVQVLPRIGRGNGKYYYDRCLFRGPEENTYSWAYCPKNSLESGKMVIGQSYMVHARFNGNYGATIDPKEGMFFDPDGEVIPCQK